MATFQQWVAGARPRTLFAAVAPVIIGTAAAAQHSEPSYAIAILAGVVALALQIGVNYANDYSDGIRGTDDSRVGPVRLVGQRLARPESVKAAAFLTFGFAAIVGLALVAIAEAWWLLPLGIASIVAAWKYTGGDNPYGYMGLGEIFVFVFFGLVATLGTMYAETGTLTWFAVAAAVGVGAIASAILVANNLRDIPTDSETGKHTLAVRLGDRGTRYLWLGLIVTSVLAVGVMAIWQLWALLGLVAVLTIYRGTQVVMGGAQGRQLVPVLGSTGKYELAYAVAVFAGVLIARTIA
ncbi:1,4-dihydroxy-2-naphthoate polyprenyltransferase [Knoellia sp. Soil729]|uniref:1,4-dihydroxy-2-naphthoate polyprenyltransferase n=1 Tax=Knoellia sp. Soil729 TaxID=1736394 RepID=UPI0006F2B1C0|nr:1,4-dihydroxy-2-naphthoate polyprenyltransferase [Knoellia sp. Soil729]KRE42353.1 1,4-dihydroxy-2-naphthoate octaprenyltransferase [Knoellia sp. Soil729]